MTAPGVGRRRPALLALLVAAVAFLPFLRGVLAGRAFYFRDLARHFFPLRRFALEGLRAGELRYWNPFTHEGEPLALPPLGYPVDALQILAADERGLSLLLALHVPLAALGALGLARRLGLGSAASAGAGLVYALGGFALSTLNLYVFLQALAWAPFLAWGLLAAAQGGRRQGALAAVVVAVALSTTAVELVGQALFLGAVLAAPWRSPARAARLAAACALGAGLAAFVLLPLGALVGASGRGAGFAPDVVLSHSVHPFALLQVVVGGLFGDPANLAARYWGQNFWPLGFPYVLSLYLGATVLALAVTGVLAGGRWRLGLVALAGVAILVCLGRWAGLEPMVAALAPLRHFRFPVKAFFTAHAAIALLVGLGLDALDGRGPRAWRRLAVVASTLGAVLLLAAVLPRLLPGPARAFSAAFFPPDMPWPWREVNLGIIARDAAMGGAVALVVALLAVGVGLGRVSPRLGVVACAALATADLLRHGAGLNPMVTSAFYSLSPQMSAEAERMRAEGGRVFTCDVAQSPTYLGARLTMGERQEAWSFALVRETLTPELHIGARLPSALSLDLTMLTPRQRVSSPREASCADLAALVPRLRTAAVRHVISLDPLPEGDLALHAIARPSSAAPVGIRVHRLRDSPDPYEVEGGSVRVLRDRPGDLELETLSTHPSRLLLRASFAPGWRASVDGRTAAITATAEGHQVVAVAAGRGRVRLQYRPPLLTEGVATSAACALLLLWLARPGHRRYRGKDIG